MAKIMNFPPEAQWIWLSPESYPDRQSAPVSYYADKNVHTYTAAFFRQDFVWDGVGKLSALVAGDCRFRIFIDGEFWCDGPPETGGDYGVTELLPWCFFEQRELPSGLTPGRHTILAEVTTWNGLQSDYSMGHGGFRFALYQDETLLQATSPKWECKLNSTAETPNRTSFHLYRDPEVWCPAAVVPDDFTSRRELCFCPLPPPMEFTVRPVRVFAFVEPERLVNIDAFLAGKNSLIVRRGAPYTFYLEYPGEFAACLELDFICRSSVQLRIAPMEILARPPDEMPCEEEIVALPQHLKFRFRNIRAVRFVRVTVDFGLIGMPGFEDLEVVDLLAHARHFPVNNTSPFDCSNSEWLAVRQCCADTLKLCMQRMHWDSPVHQEGLGCIGDYRFEALQSYYLFGEYRLARQDLIRIAKMLNHTGGELMHTSFTLFYPIMLRDYLLYSGDMSLLDEPGILSAINSVLERVGAMRGPEGTVSQAVNYLFIDWVSYGEMSFHHPCAAGGMAVMTALYAMALAADGEISEYRGDVAGSDRRRREFCELKESFNRCFFDSERGCYVNGVPHLSKIAPNQWLPPDGDEVIVTAHSGITAVAAQLASPEIIRLIMPELLRRVSAKEVQPYFCNFMFEALAHSEFMDTGFQKLMNLWYELYSQHPESLKESWYGGDYSHAWSGAPAIWIGREVLGVFPLAPGFRRCRITPHHCGLTHATGSVPTPWGDIRIAWERDDRGGRLMIVHPAEVVCDIDAVGLGDVKIEENGKWEEKQCHKSFSLVMEK